MDTTEQKVCDKYFLYAPATIVEAKRMVVNVRMCEGKLDDALEGLRKEVASLLPKPLSRLNPSPRGVLAASPCDAVWSLPCHTDGQLCA